MDNTNIKADSYEDILSIIIIGDQYVGKTSLMKRFTDNSFVENTLGTVGKYTHISGIESYRKVHVIKQSKYLIKIWDTCGQEQFRSLTTNYFRNAEGVILAYDITDENSFFSLKIWLNSLKTNCPENIPKIIIGNKIDSEQRAITTKTAKEFADTNKIKLFETSAKNNENVNEAFNYLFLEMIKYKKEITRDSIMISPKRESVKHKCSC